MKTNFKGFMKLMTCFLIITTLTFTLQIADPGMSNYTYALEENVQDQADDNTTTLDVNNLESGMSGMQEPTKLAIFKDVVFKVDGVEVAEESSLEIKDGTEMRLEYKWELADDVDLKAGDYAEISIPNEFKLETDETGYLQFGEIVIGTYTITKDTKMLKVVFNDKLQGLTQRSGEIWAQVEFELNEFTETTKKVIQFEQPITKQYTITLKPKVGTLIEKTGEANALLNATKIYWTIDINTNLDNIEAAVITDTIPAGLALDGEIEIYNLDVGYEGTLKEGSKVKNADDFPIELGDINSAYRIKYTTKIEDTSTNDFTNTVKITGTNGVSGTDSYKVNTPRGKVITKSDGVPDQYFNAKEITWKIQVNTVNTVLNNAVVTDELVEGLSLVNDSVIVYKLKINDDGTTSTEYKITSVNYSYENKKLEIKLGDIDTAYEIEYKTSIDYGDTKNDFGREFTFNNTAILSADNVEDEQATSQATVERGKLFEKIGNAEFTPTSKTIEWKIIVNEAEAELSNVVIADTIGAGHELITDSIEINGNEIAETDNRFVSLSKNGFNIKLGDIANKQTITYKTTITELYHVGEFSNSASMTSGDGGNGVGTDGPVIVKVGNGLVDYRLKKWHKNIDYDAKTMSWKSTMYLYRGKVTSLTLTDFFEPSKSMVFLPDSLIIKLTTINGTKTLTKNTDYTLSPKDGGYENGYIVELTFSDEDKVAGEYLQNAELTLYYDTSFDPDEENIVENDEKRYINKINFKGQIEHENSTTTDLDGTVQAYEDINDTAVNRGKKVGELDRSNREIKWLIYVNYLGKDYSTFEIEDTFSTGQKLDVNSFVVKEYAVNNKGEISIIDDNELQAGTDYQVVENSDKLGFTLTFTNGITKPYVVQYYTKIEGLSQEYYSNKSEVTGDHTYEDSVFYKDHDSFLLKEATNIEGDRVWLDDEINWELTINTSLSDIEEGSTLVDEISDGLIYVNDSVRVYDNNNQEVAQENYSVEINGQKLTIIFNMKINSEYKVKYSTVVAAKMGDISNNATYSGGSLQTVSNSKVEIDVKQSSGGTGSGVYKGSITIRKVDEDGNTITDDEAEFELYYMLNGNKRLVGEETYKTVNGVLNFAGLSLRKYYLKEIQAPEGYVLDDNTVELDLNSNEKDIDYNFENCRIKGNIEFTKVDDEQNLLQGAEFSLYDKSDNEFKMPVATATSDEKGKVTFADISYGDYIIKETKAPTGYIASTVELDVRIEENGKTITLSNEPIINPIIRGDIEVKKVGEENNPLSGAQFQLLQNDEVKYTSEFTDDTGSIVFKDIVYGIYTLKESIAPEGYVLSDQTFAVVIDESSGGTVQSFTFTNNKIRGSIEIFKHRKNSTRPIEGAKIGVYSEDDTLIDEKTTDSTGKVLFQDLEYGGYYFKELVAPKGYKLDRSNYYFDIEYDNVVLNMDLINKKISSNSGGEPEEPEESGEPEDPEEPVEPEDPEEPGESEEPEEPGESEEPEDPEEPGESEEREKPEVVIPPENGTVEFDEDGNWEYVPDEDFTGKDEFTIRNEDGTEELIEIVIEAPLGGTDELPNTGEDSDLWLQLTGLLLILLGISLKRRIV